MSPETNRPVRLPFLLEIGSEEIPARFIPAAMADLARLLGEELEKAHLGWEGLRVLATPRRLAVLIDALDTRQPDRELTVKGPPVSVAFGADGRPTPAAEGFARKVGIALADCGRDTDQRGEFLVAHVSEPGRPAAEVLAEIVPRAVLGVAYRKTMRWGDHDLEYPRPLQWILSLLGDDVVPLRVDYLEAGRTTRGHRTLAADRAAAVAHPGDYEHVLRELGVIVDQDERRRLITAGLAAELASRDATAVLLADDELLTEVVFLCEHPTPFLGTFSEEYLDLPAEVITTALKAHQRYFSVGRSDGAGLRPLFAAVRDGGRDHLDNVIRGNERVLHARLADAHFYWTFDQKKSPDERTAMLGTVTWLEGFGSVLDKTDRLGDLAAWLWENGPGEGAVPEDLRRAARICKSDLVSEMIKDGKEFTKLEGFIGARYAALAGENAQVCRSIERHYLPRSAAGVLPRDRQAEVLSIADRLDTVAGCWLAGFAPTGAKDPYALRRHVLAILRILLENDLRLDLDAALDRALSGVAGFRPGADLPAVRAELGEFVRTRLEGFLVDAKGAEPAVVRAVLPVRWRDPVDAWAWVQALDGYREQDDFQLLATGFKRCRNILKEGLLPVAELDACRARWLAGGRGADGEDFADLPEAPERDLWQATAAAMPALAAAEASRDYHQVFAFFSGLGPAIDRYFDQVRVNTDDPGLTASRHAFLRELDGLFAQYADFAAVAAADL
ncbi:glycine--tRNA ligase subunit beta [bacterium]|nr:glycine--tRNA ligase subunit beta [bacterium]